MRWLFAFVIARSACRAAATTARSIDVFALAGEVQLEAGATRAGHHRRRHADRPTDHRRRRPRRSSQYEPGALVTIVFVRMSVTQLVTTPALATGMLAIHGPLAGPGADHRRRARDHGAADHGRLVRGRPRLHDDRRAEPASHREHPRARASAPTRASTCSCARRSRRHRRATPPRACRSIDEVGMLDISDWTMLSDTSIPDHAERSRRDDHARRSRRRRSCSHASDRHRGVDRPVADQSRVHAVGRERQPRRSSPPGSPPRSRSRRAIFCPPATTQLTRAQLDVLVDRVRRRRSGEPPRSVADRSTWDAVLPPDATTIGFPDPTHRRRPPMAVTTLRCARSTAPTRRASTTFKPLGLHPGPTGATIVPPPTRGEVRETNAL